MRDMRETNEERPRERHCGGKGKRQGEMQKGKQRERKGSWMISSGWSRVDMKWRFHFFAKYNYRYLLDAIIVIIATFFAEAIIAMFRLLLFPDYC
jgi:hypothetical protein